MIKQGKKLIEVFAEPEETTVDLGADFAGMDNIGQFKESIVKRLKKYSDIYTLPELEGIKIK